MYSDFISQADKNYGPVDPVTDCRDDGCHSFYAEGDDPLRCENCNDLA